MNGYIWNGAPRASPCLHAEVPAFAETFRAGVPARRRGPPKPSLPTPRLRWVIRRWAKSAEAWHNDHCIAISRINAFLHGQGRGFLRRRMKIWEAKNKNQTSQFKANADSEKTTIQNTIFSSNWNDLPKYWNLIFLLLWYLIWINNSIWRIFNTKMQWSKLRWGNWTSRFR